MAKEEFDKEKALSPQEEAFCKAYGEVESETYGVGTKSVIVAGYAEKSAHTHAWKLLRRPRIKARLQEIYDTFDFTAAKIMTNLANDRLRALKKDDVQAAIRADELMGKRLGMFLEQSIIHQTDEPRELTEREIEEAKRLAEIRLRQGA